MTKNICIHLKQIGASFELVLFKLSGAEKCDFGCHPFLTSFLNKMDFRGTQIFSTFEAFLMVFKVRILIYEGSTVVMMP